MSRELKTIIEALLFVSETPLTLAQLCQVLEDKQRDAVKQALEDLVQEYAQAERAVEIAQVAGGWVLRTRKEMAFWLRKLKKQQVTRLSKAALETLSVVAYKQPVLKAEIERIRGVEVGGILRTLMEKNLVRVAGREDLPGKPLIYCTTRRFLEVFDLKDLNDLPTLEELEKLAGIAQDTPADLDDELPLGRPPAPTLDDLVPVEGGLPPLKESETDEGEADEWDAAPEQKDDNDQGDADTPEDEPREAAESEAEAAIPWEPAAPPDDRQDEPGAPAPEPEPETEPGPGASQEPEEPGEARPKTDQETI